VVEVRGASAPSLETTEADSEADVVDAETKDTHGTGQREVPAKYTSTAHTSAELLEQITGTAVDSPLCMTCGTKMRPAGSCYVCEGCGSTSGCS
jgi:ribonucleoside-diphosphate reductase alpha chain